MRSAARGATGVCTRLYPLVPVCAPRTASARPFAMAWTSALGLCCIMPGVWAQSTGPDTVALTAAAPGVVRTGTFTNEFDSATLVVTAPAGSTLDFVVELNPRSSSTSVTDDVTDLYNVDSNPTRADVWTFARLEVAAGDSAPIAASACASKGGDNQLDGALFDGTGGIQLAGIVETTWSFTVTYARPPGYSLRNNACNGKCTDTTFEIADFFDGTNPPRTCPQIIDSYEPYGNEPATHPCTDTLGAQPWRLTVATTPAPVVQALPAPESSGDGATLQWQADPPVTSKDWLYVSSDLNDWPRSGETESLEASFAFATSNAGMLVMVEYGRPPTATRKIGHTVPFEQVGYFFSTAYYDGTGPRAPTECGDDMRNCPSNQGSIPIDLWRRDGQRQPSISCELPAGVFADAYAGRARSAADQSKVFIAMRLVETSSFPATPIIKMEYGTYCTYPVQYSTTTFQIQTGWSPSSEQFER